MLFDAVFVDHRRRAGQRHEAQVQGQVVGGAEDLIGPGDQRIVGLQGDIDGAVAALVDQIQAVVEELAEDGHEAVEGRGQPDIGRHMVDHQPAIGPARQAVILERGGQKGRGALGRAGGACGHDRGVIDLLGGIQLDLRRIEIGLRSGSRGLGGGARRRDGVHAVRRRARRARHRRIGVGGGLGRGQVGRVDHHVAVQRVQRRQQRRGGIRRCLRLGRGQAVQGVQHQIGGGLRRQRRIDRSRVEQGFVARRRGKLGDQVGQRLRGRIGGKGRVLGQGLGRRIAGQGVGGGGMGGQGGGMFARLGGQHRLGGRNGGAGALGVQRRLIGRRYRIHRGRRVGARDADGLQRGIDRRRVGGRLIDDQVRDRPGIAVHHVSAGGVIGVRHAVKGRLVPLVGINRVQKARKGGADGAVVLGPRQQVVVAPVDGAQPHRHQRRIRRADPIDGLDGLNGRHPPCMKLGHLDLLENEFQVVLVNMKTRCHGPLLWTDERRVRRWRHATPGRCVAAG